MIRISAATVKQTGFAEPRITRREQLSERALRSLDAVLVILPQAAAGDVLAKLPHATRWKSLFARLRQNSGGVRATVLPNERETRAVLGIASARASTFELLALAGRMVKELPAGEADSVALVAPASGSDAALEALLAAVLAQAFSLPSFRARAARAHHIRSIELVGGRSLDLAYCRAVAAGTNLTRYLTAMPPNELDARAYLRLLRALARASGLTLRWLDERRLKRLGAGAFLAVAAGNADRGAGIAQLSYRPRGKRRRAPDVALIGKGIIFDTGGTNSKPHRAMLEMHTDMAGSAVALSTLLALARLRAPIAADAWLAITENRTGPTAYKPQDVVRAANGVTIQVIHTDAEGRMVLADTLALAARRRPRLMIDFATLTGACVYALTERMSGFFTNTPQLEPTLRAAGRASGERVWGFPFDADYDSDLESKVADILQCSPESKGDHILAARFLSRFVPAATPWVHLDLSSAMRGGGLGHIGTDITGFGVRYTLELLLKQKALSKLGSPA